MSLGGVECEVCAQCKGPSTRRQGRLQKVLSGAPIDVVAVDVLSGLPICVRAGATPFSIGRRMDRMTR